MAVLYFAGGCFWGIEHAFRQLDGVLGTTAGYANGHVDNPTYCDVKHGDTGHRETVEVVYDPSVVSVQTLLKAFFILIDPERDDGQGNDIGDQYRTGVYYPADSDPPGGIWGGEGKTQQVLHRTRTAFILLQCRGIPSGLSREEPDRVLPCLRRGVQGDP